MFRTTIPEWLLRLENSALLNAFRESLFAYPIVEGAHLLGLSLAVGLLALVDLRLAGVLLKDTPIHKVVVDLRPWFIGGFTAVILTGLFLFIAKASLFYGNWIFWTKMGLIVLAGLNALHFEIAFRRTHSASLVRGSPAAAAWITPRASGLISLAFWLVVIAMGRLLAYFQ